MAGKSKYSDEFKQAVIDRYVAGETMRDLCEEVGINVATGFMWLEKAGVATKINKKGNKGSKARVCHKCGNTDHNGKAMYCCMCGAKLKSDADFLIDDINYIADMTQFFPASTRDKIIATVNKAVAYIKAAEKEKKDNGNDL